MGLPEMAPNSNTKEYLVDGDGEALSDTPSVLFGDDMYDPAQDYGDATWAEVCTSCFCHSAQDWVFIALASCCVICFLYWFLFGLELVSGGANVLTGCLAGTLFGDDTNPVAALMIGILSTALLQSSSTTTSIVVSLVGSAISVQTGIYMIMGANIGTSVTNTIVAMGQSGHLDQLERAFTGATVHDMFNFLTVGILLPVEAATHYLAALTAACVKNATADNGGADWKGPVKVIVSPLVDLVIMGNQKFITNVASGSMNCSYGGGGYPIECANPSNPSYDGCPVRGLIDCSEQSNACPAFFQVTATASDDKVSGGVVLFLGLAILFFCLFGLVSVLQKLLFGVSARIVYKATDVNGYIAILVGCIITIVVQSSSITTSTLTPLVGLGVLRVEQMYPLTLGANLGTTVTALLAASVSSNVGALQVALAHLFFNITGILIFYPVPFMRRIPIWLAKQLGKSSRIWRGIPVIYIIVMFFLVPLAFLGISLLFTQDKIGFTVLGSFLVVLIFMSLIYVVYYCFCLNGQERCIACCRQRERRAVAFADLPDDMEELRSVIQALVDHTGLVIEESVSELDIEEEDGS